MLRHSVGWILLFFSIGLTSASATPQIPDILIYEGKNYPIQVELLGKYFETYPDRKPEIETVCSALWRGYIATFEIVDSTVVLKDVVADGCGVSRPALKTVVPDGRPLKIDWYTGLLRSAHGRNDEDLYSLKSLDAYEQYSLFEIEAGVFHRAKHFNNAQYLAFKKKQFAAFKKTVEYRNEVERMTAGGRLTTSDADANILLWLEGYTKKFLID